VTEDSVIGLVGEDWCYIYNGSDHDGDGGGGNNNNNYYYILCFLTCWLNSLMTIYE
jgi:hypothetical protein